MRPEVEVTEHGGLGPDAEAHEGAGDLGHPTQASRRRAGVGVGQDQAGAQLRTQEEEAWEAIDDSRLPTGEGVGEDALGITHGPGWVGTTVHVESVPAQLGEEVLIPETRIPEDQLEDRDVQGASEGFVLRDPGHPKATLPERDKTLWTIGPSG